MKLTTQGLSTEQLAVLDQAGPWLANAEFYLAGGTALAIYYGHRRSEDLDWFTSAAITDPLLLTQHMRDAGIAFETGQTAPGTLYGFVQGVRVSFIEFRYPMLQALFRWPENGVLLAGLDDLACMKLSAIAQRGSRKDFYDVHILIKRYKPLGDLLRLYQQKFQVQDLSPVLYGLTYFDDAEDEPEVLLLEKMTWKQVKREVLEIVREYLKANAP